MQHKSAKDLKKSNINSDLLYDLIKKLINEFCVLFQFLDIKDLSDEIV